MGPDLGKIEDAINQRVAVPAGIAEKDTDLALLNPPGGARVLPLYADRLRPFLDEAGLIQDQHAIGIAQLRDNVGLRSSRT